jgi:hypothetical protein
LPCRRCRHQLARGNSLFVYSWRSAAMLADVFARAQVQIQEGSDHCRYNEYLADQTQRISGLKAKEKAVQKETLQYCLEKDLGDHVQVRVFEDDDFCVFRIIRSHPTRKPLAIVPGRAARAIIESSLGKRRTTLTGSCARQWRPPDSRSWTHSRPPEGPTDAFSSVMWPEKDVAAMGPRPRSHSIGQKRRS